MPGWLNKKKKKKKKNNNPLEINRALRLTGLGPNNNCDQMMCSCDQLRKLVATSATSGKNESRALMSKLIANFNFWVNYCFKI